MSANRSATFDRDYRLCWSTESTFVVGGIEVNGVCCSYCGEYATVREHLVPFSFIRARTSKGSPNDNFWTWILPSCEECNCIAQAQVFQTPEDKRDYIQGRLAARYEVDLISEPWSDDELDDLGPSLGQYVFACQARAYITRGRVHYSGPLPPTVGSDELEDAVIAHYGQMRET
jgi:hypothetical protein